VREDRIYTCTALLGADSEGSIPLLSSAEGDKR
jgi:hypothetical protein